MRISSLHNNGLYNKWKWQEILLLLIMLFVQIKDGQIIAILLSMVVVTRCIITNGSFIRRVPLFLFIWISVLFIMLVNTRYNTTETWIELSWLAVGLIVMLTTVHNTEVINHRAQILLIPTALMCTANILYYYKVIDLSIIFTSPYAGTRMQGGFDGPNELGAFLVIVLSYVWIHHIYSGKIKFIVPFSIIILICIILTWSRGALLALAISGIVVLVNRIKYSKGKKRLLVILSTIVVVGAMCIVINRYIMPELLFVRRNATDRDYSEVIASTLSTNPIIGQGFNSFRVYGLNTVPHSSYILFLVSGGIMGLLALIYLYFSIIKAAWKKRYLPEFFALISYYILEQGFNNIVRGRVLFIFLVIFIYVFSDRSNYQNDEESRSNYQYDSINHR